MTPRLTLDYGVRWEIYTPITERAHRTGAARRQWGPDQQRYVINPQPGYKTNDLDWAARAGGLAGDAETAGARRRGQYSDSAEHLAG